MIKNTYIQKRQFVAWLFLAAMLFPLTVKSFHTHDNQNQCQYSHTHCHEQDEKKEESGPDHPCSICQFTFSFFLENTIGYTEVEPILFAYPVPVISMEIYSPALPGYYLRGPPQV